MLFKPDVQFFQFFPVFAQDAPSWDEIITYYRGSELQNYFKKMVSENLKAVLKPQYIDQIQQVITTEVRWKWSEHSHSGQNKQPSISDKGVEKMLFTGDSATAAGQERRQKQPGRSEGIAR